MKSAVVTFPASNCNRDMFDALEKITGKTPYQIWHQDSEIPDVDSVSYTHLTLPTIYSV